MKIRLVDPKGSLTQTHRTRAPRPVSLNGLTVGLLSNQKVNADVLLREVGHLFEQHHGCEALDVVEKLNASLPADPAQLDDLARESDLLIVAAGD